MVSLEFQEQKLYIIFYLPLSFLNVGSTNHSGAESLLQYCADCRAICGVDIGNVMLGFSDPSAVSRT